MRGRCGPRFVLPTGAPAKCDPRLVEKGLIIIHIQEFIFSVWLLVVLPEVGVPVHQKIVCVMVVFIMNGKKV